jgi:CheY-like chemotaxis protein
VGKTALIIDDDPFLLDALRESLRHDGYVAVPAANGHEALDLLDTGLRPDVIVLDLLMPGMDGWDFRMAQMNRPSVASIPVLVISASGFSKQTIMKQLRVDEYLPKPLDAALVARALDRMSDGQSSSSMR